MLKRLSAFQKLFIPVLVCIVLLVPFVVYQRYYVTWKADYLSQRSLRILSALGDQLQALLNIEAAKFRAAGFPFHYDTQRNKDYREQWWKEAFRGTVFSTDIAQFQGGPNWSKALATVEPDAASPSGAEAAEASTLRFRFTYTASAEKGASVQLTGAYDLAAEFRGSVEKIAGTWFDDVLISDQNGRVLFENSTSVLRVRRLDELLPVGRAEQAPASNSGDASAQAAGHDRSVKVSAGSQETFRAKTQATAVFDVQVAGSDYKLFIQPVHAFVDRASSKNSVDLIACGLFRLDRFRAESFAVDYRILIRAALMVLLAFSISWPFLKATSMSSKDRFRHRDGWILVLSTTFGTVLITLLLLNLGYEYIEHRLTKQNLQDVAHSIRDRFYGEIKKYVDEAAHMPEHAELPELTSGRWEPWPDLPLTCKRPGVPAGHFHQYDQVFWADLTDGQQLVKLLVKAPVTPKTNVGDFDFFRGVKSEQYFPRALHARVDPVYSPNTGEFQLLVSTLFEPGSKEYRAHLGPLDDKHAVEVIVTRPLSIVEPLLPPGYSFAVLNARGGVIAHSDLIRNLHEDFLEECRRDPYLAGALATGKDEHLEIDYMGQRSPAHITRLFDDPVNPWSVVVFMDSTRDRTAQMMTTLFCGVLLGIPGLLVLCIAAADILWGRTRPPDFVWPHRERAANYVYLTLSNAMLVRIFFEWHDDLRGARALFASAAIVGAALFAAALPVHKLPFRIPTPLHLRRITGIYYFNWRAVLLLVYAAALIVFSIPLAGSHPGSFWLSLVLALFGLAAAFLPVERLAPPHFARAFTFCVVSLLVTLVIIPTMGAYKASSDTVTRLKTRAEELRLRTEILNREAALGQEYRFLIEGRQHADAQTSKAALNAFIQQRLEGGRYYDLLYETRDGKYPGEHLSTLERLLSILSWYCVPSSRPGGEMIATVSDVSGAGSDSDGSRAQWASAAGVPILRISDQRVLSPKVDAERKNQLEIRPAILTFRTLAIWLVIFGLAIWVYLLVRRISLPVSEAPPLPQVNWTKAEDIDYPHIIIGHARSLKTTKLRQLPGLPPPVDLRVALGTYLGGNWPKFEFTAKKAIVLDHFEFNIDDPDSNMARLEILERLLYVEKANVVIISTVDPLYYLAEERDRILTANRNCATITLLFDRWSRALSKFKKVELQDESGEAFEPVKKMAHLSGWNDWQNVFAIRTPSERKPSKVRSADLSPEERDSPARYLIVGDEYRSKLDPLAEVKRPEYSSCRIFRLDLAADPAPDLLNVRQRIVQSHLVLIDHFERVRMNPMLGHEVLNLLMHLCEESDASVFIYSEFDPLEIWNADSASEYAGSPEDAAATLSYWRDVLDRFPRIDRVVAVAQELEAECDVTAYLRRTARALFSQYSVSRAKLDRIVSKKELVPVLLDRVDSYYGILWASFTEGERLVLYQLARDGWANPLNGSAARQLQRKEFICVRAMYKIMNESFRQFVLSISNSVEIASWQKQEADSSWRAFRAGIITVFLGLGAWLLYSQKDLFQISLGYIVTLGGAITAIMNLVGSMSGQSSKSRPA